MTVSIHTRKSFRKRNAGFTLIELLVVMSIILILSSVILIKHASFRSALTLRSLAYEIALAVRQAQVYGLGIREYKPAGPSLAFQVGYGVYFTTSDPTHFRLFADVNQDRDYDVGVDGVIETFTLSGGHQIVQLCADADCGTTRLDIVYERPNPKAFITAGAGTGTVRIRSRDGSFERTVTMTITGQISVQ